MKKIIFVVLISLVFAMGCSKKYAKAPEVKGAEDKSVTEKSVSQDADTEIVTDISVPVNMVSDQDIRSNVSAEDAAALTNEVLFDFNKYTIRQDARPLLNSSASYLKNKKQISVIIEGHGDERGTNDYNLALGEKRAKAVKDYMASLGVSNSRMNYITYGEEKPVCTEQHEECWQKNRRARIVVQ